MSLYFLVGRYKVEAAVLNDRLPLAGPLGVYACRLRRRLLD